MPRTGRKPLTGDWYVPLVKDPGCGMMIDSSSTAASSEHQGMTHYFCSAACKQKVDANPSAYAGAMQH